MTIRIETVNLAWQLGHNAELLEHVCADADVVLVVEALADGGKAPASLAELLPDGWETSQVTTDVAKAGSAVCWRTATMRHRSSGLEQMSRPGRDVRARYLNHALLEHRSTGDARRYGALHAPRRITGRQGEFFRNAGRWIAAHPHAVLGGDFNRRPRWVTGQLGRTCVGASPMGLVLPAGLKVGPLATVRLPWSDHAILSLPAQPRPRAVVDQVIDVARAEVGTHEGRTRGRWNNHTKYADEVPGLEWADGQPWCATFVAWVGRKAGHPELYPVTASCDVAANWWKARRRWTTIPSRGAQVFYGSPRDLNHTGIVIDFDARTITTIEGNTNDNGSREGDGVYIKTRPRSSAIGYGHPVWPITARKAA